MTLSIFWVYPQRFVEADQCFFEAVLVCKHVT